MVMAPPSVVDDVVEWVSNVFLDSSSSVKSSLGDVKSSISMVVVVDELKSGARIGIPNDPTNGGRALLLLQDKGLIKVDPKVGLKATPIDVTETPKNLRFVELDAAQLSRHLDAALQRLTPAHRSVVELTFLLDYSYEEAAEIVGCPVNTVKTRMFHARAKLRLLLAACLGRKA